MQYPFYFNRGVQKTFLHSIKILLKDIKKLEQERIKFNEKYRQAHDIDNLFYARAKHIEQMLILGSASEYLMKSTLLKHNFVINKSTAVKFSKEFSMKLGTLNNSGFKTTAPQIEEVEKLSLKNLDFKFKSETLSFEECKQIFNKEIAKQGYFPHKEYFITNPETQEFYGKKLDYKTAWNILQKIRNNYGHIPESKSEQNGILPFLYNFLIYVAKKEFPTIFKHFKKFKEP